MNASTGTVTNITDFGVFVDLGGVEGLIHISELSWGRVIHPNQIVKMGKLWMCRCWTCSRNAAVWR